MTEYKFLDLGDDMGISLSRNDALEVTQIFVEPCPTKRGRFNVRLRYSNPARAQSLSVPLSRKRANTLRQKTAQQIADFLNLPKMQADPPVTIPVLVAADSPATIPVVVSDESTAGQE